MTVLWSRRRGPRAVPGIVSYGAEAVIILLSDLSELLALISRYERAAVLVVVERQTDATGLFGAGGARIGRLRRSSSAG